ncbi:MAG: hypothetical protein EPO32_13895 [Anaerolineae bacterium]|nr:MAG: hypothetical protein EPO32_13895 [Anaerolineae bacterium]
MVSHTHQQHQRLSQRQVVTAHLAQTMSLLELNRQEMHERVGGEIAQNPALELVDERRCPNCGRRLDGPRICPTCSFARGLSPNEPVVFVSNASDFNPGPSSREDYTPAEDYSPEIEDLATFVGRQLTTELDEEDFPVVTMILTSLDEDGLLPVPLVEIAQFRRVTLSRAETIQRAIQRCEPLGVGSSTHQDALRVQLEFLSESRAIDPDIFRAIQEPLTLLTRNHADRLAKQLGVTLPKARRIIKFITNNLNPYPARANWGTTRQPAGQSLQRYSQPDVIVSCIAEAGEPRLQVEIVWPLRGTLRVNPEIIAAAKLAPPEKAEEWDSMIERATLLVKCLSQRNHTLVRLMGRLAVHQREFILHGATQMLPLTRASLAEELGLHESTISRAVQGKSIQLPHGQIIPISRFFDRSLNVRTVLRGLIENEDKPLSDAKLAKLLSEQGFEVARRTVAKYRSMEKILPAHQRG